MQPTVNPLYVLYTDEKNILLDAKKISIEEVECSGSWKTEQRKKGQKQKKEGTSNPYPKKSVLWIKRPEQVEQKLTPTIQILIL